MFTFSKKQRLRLPAWVSMAIALTASLLFTTTAQAAPQAVADTFSTPVGTRIAINPLRNDRSDSGSWIFVRWAAQPVNNTGTTTFSGNSIVYTPRAGFTGTAKFWYSIQDSNGLRSGAVVSVAVGVASNPAPIARADFLSTRSDRPLTIYPLSNDTGSNLRVTFVNPGSSLGSRQTIVGGNRISYTPSRFASGADTFWYQVTDSQGRKNAAKVTVSVTRANTAGAYPTAGSDFFTVNRDSTGNAFSLFRNDTGSGITFNTFPAYTRNGGRVFPNGGNGNVTYNPPRAFAGTDEFWYTIKDSLGRTNSAKVTITVRNTNTGTNRAPDAVEDILRSTINAPEFAINVLANDTDPNGDTLRVLRVDPARSGTVRLNNGRVLYRPPSFPTSDTFRYTITDGRGGTASAAATIGVRDPSGANTNNPIVNNEFVTTSPGQSIVIRVLDNDRDPDGDTLILDQVTGGSQGSTTKIRDGNGRLNWVRYTPLSSASGTDVFYYGVADGRGGNGSGKVTVTIR